MTNENQQLAEGEVVITRTLHASQQTVFNAWAGCEQLSQWWAPSGCTLSTCEVDLRTGGEFRHGMRTAEGVDMWGKWAFREVIPPKMILFVGSFLDEQGNVTRHPGIPDWPLEMLARITMEEHKSHTKLTIRWTPISPSPNERKAFEEAREMSLKGWAGILDQLTAYLAANQ